jgi:hypothetical protein
VVLVVIQSDRTICATAERAEAEGHRRNRSENNPSAWLGTTASWRERRLFDWWYLRSESIRSGNLTIASQATVRAAGYAVPTEAEASRCAEILNKGTP